MPLLYAVVARGTCVLAEHSATTGNAAEVAFNILSKTASVDSQHPETQSPVKELAALMRAGLPMHPAAPTPPAIGRDPTPGDAKAGEQHLFHLLCEDGLIFLCMADEVFGRRIPYVFLEDVQARFTAMHGHHATVAPSYAFQEDFSPVLAQQMEYFSTNFSADTVSRVRGEILDVKRGMVENIDKILDRGDKIDLLVDKASTLQGEAFKFKRHTRTIRKTFWWQNVYYLLAIFIVVMTLVYGGAALLCGWTFQQCHHHQ